MFKNYVYLLKLVEYITYYKKYIYIYTHMYKLQQSLFLFLTDKK